MSPQDRRGVLVAVVIFIAIVLGLLVLGYDLGERPLPNQ